MSRPRNYPLGAILLITIGVLLLLQMTMPGWGFDQTWPVILIVIGLVKLAERFGPNLPSGGAPPVPPA